MTEEDFKKMYSDTDINGVRCFTMNKIIKDFIQNVNIIKELKENNKMLEQGYIWHDYDAGEDCYEDTHEGKWVKRDEVYQLTKAKKLLRKVVTDFHNMDCVTVHIDKTIAQAEQFLSEMEK